MSGINQISGIFNVTGAIAAGKLGAIGNTAALSGALAGGVAGAARKGGSAYATKLATAKKAILYIMNNDKECRKINKEAQAEKIARIALDVGVKPEIIGAIIKQETHFSTNAKDMNKGNGVGPMQLTRITIQDMYERPKAYDPDITKIVGNDKGCKYKTFADALKAKLKNKNINLGKFGNKFFEFYQQNQTYFDKGYYLATVNPKNKNHKGKIAVKYNQIPKSILNKYESTLTNYDMNVYLGCYTYKEKTKGCSSEEEALKKYNSSNIANSYVKAVNDTICQTRRAVPEIKKLNIKS